MIALKNNLPLLQLDGDQLMECERNWLVTCLVSAAERAGYRKWWLAPHVTESVLNFLEQDFSETTITHCRLEQAVRSVLQVIGYGDVGAEFRLLPPPARISLAELAQDAGHGYELVFFDLLRSRMREALEGRAEKLEITDAHRGIKILKSAKTWRRDCSGLLDEVVGFIRGELHASRPAGEVQLQLS